MAKEQQSFFQNILGNRFLKYLIPYVIGAWGIIQVAAFLESRYSWANGWPDFLLIIGLAMLPAVFYFSYQRTGDFADRLHKSERILYPVNFLIAIALAWLGINAASTGINKQEIGAQIEVLNEDGTSLERFVPSKNMIKRVVLLPWENKANNSDIQWMAFALPQILNADMEQDNRLITIPPEALASSYREYSIAGVEVPPFSIQRKIALDKYSNYFMTGSIEKNELGYQVNAKLVNTENGKEIYTKKYEHSDPFIIVDQINEDFRKEIYVENELPENFVDLPVSNLYTSSLDALKAYTDCMYQTHFNKNTTAAISAGERAIQLDPKFSMASLLLGICYLQNNQGNEGIEMLNHAMEHQEALSERMQFNIKYFDLLIAKQNPQKAIQLLEMWSQLYPMDYIPYSNLINLYVNLNESEKAKNAALRALENGHTGSLLLSLATIENSQGNYDEALAYYDQFNKEFPHKSKDVTGKGNTYLSQGEFDKAKEYFEQAIVLEPQNTELLRKLAEIQGKQGNFDEQLKVLNEALSLEKQLNDSLIIYNEINSIYLTTGQLNKYFSESEKVLTHFGSRLPSFMQNMAKVSPLYMLAMMDQEGRTGILEELLQAARSIDPALGSFECMVEANYYIFSKNKEMIKVALDKCGEDLSKYQAGVQNDIIEAYSEKILGNYDKAMEAILSAVEVSKLKLTDFEIIGELHALKQEYPKAIAHYESMLKVNPSNPKILLYLAKVYNETGDKAKAKSTIEKALIIWENADSNYIPAKEARELLSSI